MDQLQQWADGKSVESSSFWPTDSTWVGFEEQSCRVTLREGSEKSTARAFCSFVIHRCLEEAVWAQAPRRQQERKHTRRRRTHQNTHHSCHIYHAPLLPSPLAPESSVYPITFPETTDDAVTWLTGFPKITRAHLRRYKKHYPIIWLSIIRFLELSDHSSDRVNDIMVSDIGLWEIGSTHLELSPIRRCCWVCIVVNLIYFILLHLTHMVCSSGKFDQETLLTPHLHSSITIHTAVPEMGWTCQPGCFCNHISEVHVNASHLIIPIIWLLPCSCKQVHCVILYWVGL